MKKLKTITQILKLLSFIFLLFALTSTLYATPVHAQFPVSIGQHFGFGGLQSLGDATSKLVDPAFGIAAALVIIFFLWGAFKYLKSGENKEELSAAKQMIIHAIIAFIILMFAFLVLQFLLTGLFRFDRGFNIFKGN